MRTSDFSHGSGIGPLSFAPGRVPHMTLETNRTCNMRCRLCYNLDRVSEKSLAEIKADLARAMTMRELAGVTILGGEPTLHPQLTEVIAEVKRLGLFCGLLTNGLRFLDADGPALIRRLRRAGVDRIYIHVDSGQKHVHPDVEAARKRIFDLLEESRVPFALSITIYGGENESIPNIIRRYSRYRRFGGILAVLAYDLDARKDLGLDLAAAYGSLKQELALEPQSFIPADVDGGEVRWLNYFYIISVRAGVSLTVSAKSVRFFEKLLHRPPGWLFFSQRLGPEFLRTMLLPLALAELLSSSRRGAAFLRKARWTELRAQFVVIQSPPKLDMEAGCASVCRSCPDATIRHGKLVPVCIADLVSPLDPRVKPVLACPGI